MLVSLLSCRPIDPFQIRHGQYSISRCRRNDLWHTYEWVIAVEPTECTDVSRLVPVVELLADTCADLAGRLQQVGRDRHSQRRGGQSQECREQCGVGEVSVDGLGGTWVLDLDRYRPAVAQHRAMDLSDGGCGHRFIAELGEHFANGSTQICLQDLSGYHRIHG